MMAQSMNAKSCIVRRIIGRAASSLCAVARTEGPSVSVYYQGGPSHHAVRHTQLLSCRLLPQTDCAGNAHAYRRHLITDSNNNISEKNKSTVEDFPPPGVEYEDLTAPLPELDRSQYTEEIKVRMPDMGEGEGKVLEWYKKEGDVIKRGDILCDIETPDFTFGMETEDEGYAIMGKILVEAPSEAVKDGEVICILLHEAKEEKKKKE